MRPWHLFSIGLLAEGRATYTKFRRYQVTVDQTLKK